MTLHDPKAEAQVLGLAMRHHTQIAEIASGIERADFYTERHRLIWDAITSLEVPDLPSVVSLLGERGQSVGPDEMTGNGAYVGSLMQGIPIWLMRHMPINRMRSLRLSRDIVALGKRMASLETSPPAGTVPEFASQCFAHLLDISERTTAKERKTLRDLAVDVRAEIDGAQEAVDSGHVLEMRSGIDSLDHLVKWRPGRYVAIGARPGEGKSSLLRQALRSFTVRHHEPCALVTLEMMEADQASAIFASETGITSERMISGKISDHERAQLEEAFAHPSNSKLWIIAPESPTWPAIERELEYLHRCHGLRAFGLDYLQLVAVAKGQSRQAGLGEVSRSIKRLCNRTGMTALVAVQLNREVEGRPKLANFRESGDIEQDCDCAVMLWTMDEQTGQRGASIAKNRRGGTGIVDLHFDGPRTTFGAWSDRP